MSVGPNILILTPIKDAVDHLEDYVSGLEQLTYPRRRLSLGFLESDSRDGTFESLRGRLPALRRRCRRVGLWKKDFGYHIPEGLSRHHDRIQLDRRRILALSRNHLLLRALDDEDFVLWLDVDTREYPSDILERLIATGKDIVEPHCVLEYGGSTYDLNAWRDQGRLHLEDLRGEGDLVPIDAVGGTMLFIRADLHRDGLVFPPFPYGLESPYVRKGRGEIETEGLGCLARDMGHQCWGMPNLEIRHVRELHPQYMRMIARIKATARQVLPRAATVLVVSKGDDDLLAIEGARGWHFPCAEDGSYPGYYPADSAAAIGQLETLRRRGGEYLVLPATALWWLDRYPEFAAHIEEHYRTVVRQPDTCLIFDLREAAL